MNSKSVWRFVQLNNQDLMLFWKTKALPGSLVSEYFGSNPLLTHIHSAFSPVKVNPNHAFWYYVFLFYACWLLLSAPKTSAAPVLSNTHLINWSTQALKHFQNACNARIILFSVHIVWMFSWHLFIIKSS